jgi:hypothetical protein
MHERERNNEEDDVRDPKFRGAVTTILHVTNDH